MQYNENRIECSRIMRFTDFFRDNDNLWFIGYRTNVLFCYNFKNRETKFACSLGKARGNRPYKAICANGTKVYVAPFSANDIIIYDCDSYETEHISLENIIGNKRPRFERIYCFEKYIFMVSRDDIGIVRFDTSTKTVDVFERGFKDLKNISLKLGWRRWGIGCCTDSKIYVPFNAANIVLEYNMKTCAFKTHRVGKCSENGYDYIINDGDGFWLLNTNGTAIVGWQGKMNGRSIAVDNKGLGSSLLKIGKEIIRVPLRGDKLCDKINRDDYSQTEFDLVGKIDKRGSRDYYNIFEPNLCAEMQGDKAYVYSAKNEYLYIFNENGKIDEQKELILRKEDVGVFAAYRRELMSNRQTSNKSTLIPEAAYNNLSIFLDVLDGNSRNIVQQDIPSLQKDV